MNDERRPLINPEAPGGLSQWMGYLAGRLEAVESWQRTQNGSVQTLVDRVGRLPCAVHDERLDGLEAFEERCSERKYQEGRDDRQSLRMFVIKTAVVVLGIIGTAVATLWIAGQCP